MKTAPAELGWPLLGILLIAGPAPAAPPAKIDFNRDIRPILSNNCYQCHGPDEKVRKAELRLDTAAGARSVLVAGKPSESELIQRVSGSDAKKIMPPVKTGKKLTANEIDLLKSWVEQGAPFAEHWAYVKPVRPSLPIIKNPAWPKNAIDHFILARLEKEGLKPTLEADRYALIRRLLLDLTGLPPKVEEVDAFINGKSPDAYDKLVERILAKDSYGEHWARMWLDLARYADSAGYADDPPRTIWAYRDYVIKSFNANKPFDQFTIEQMAGDLLSNPTEEQLIATAFHRNTLTNNEGGTNDEEFRNVAIVDRVNTTLAVWMGTSIMCAQCHSHKYDPISQKEFFGLFAFLNNTEDADRGDESPYHSIFTDKQRQDVARLKTLLPKVEKAARAASPGSQVQAVVLRKQVNTPKPFTTVPILRELQGAQRRKTRLQFRGNFLDLGEEVSEHVPAAFAPLTKDAPRNRLALAKWLISDDNPLTARVIANRYWEQIFGIGLVRTSEEFGSQGEQPSHPELLDYLATELIRLRWDLKKFLHLLVTSATYRQSSRVTPELVERDPENRLLARGPRVRLSAEMVRDQALFVSGLLSPKMYGPSVKPPQPKLGINAAFGRSIDWQTSAGEDSHRRGLYTEWRRSNPYPSMATFDAPNREVCTIRRNRTNTPLQALVTLNDTCYVEAAQTLARRMVQAAPSPSERARVGFRLCLARHPSEQELGRLVRLHDEALAGFQKTPDKARQLATSPQSPLPPGANVADLAAWTVVANVLLNLDEMVLKR